MGRGGLDGRLRKLEEQAGEEGRAVSEEQEKERWLREMGFERARLEQEETPADVVHTRDLIGLFRLQYLIPGMGTDELVDRILRWRPMPHGGRSRAAVEREVGLAIHRGEPGTEGMEIPSAWHESFAAGDELRERYETVPDEALAEYCVRQERIEEAAGDGEDLESWAADREEGFGIPRDLEERAIGPDAAEIALEESRRRIDGYLADLVFGEKGYRVWRHAERLRGSILDPTGGGG